MKTGPARSRKPPATADAVMAALARRYQPPAWALLAQVGNGTGWHHNRWADAIAMGLWPSRGLDLHGFEIKSYRTDWLRELKNPAKAEDIASYCDFWWIVAGGKGLVDLAKDPIPASWGVLELDGRGLVQVKAAERRKATEIDRPMLAAILRRSSEHMTPKASIKTQIETAREEGIETGKQLRESNSGETALRLKADGLERRIADFEKASGVLIEDWRGERQGRAFKLAIAITELQGDHRLVTAEREMDNALASIKRTRGILAGTEPEKT